MKTSYIITLLILAQNLMTNSSSDILYCQCKNNNNTANSFCYAKVDRDYLNNLDNKARCVSLCNTIRGNGSFNSYCAKGAGCDTPTNPECL